MWCWSEWHDLDKDGLIDFPKVYFYNIRTEAEEALKTFKSWERNQSKVKVLSSEVVYMEEQN